MCGIGNELVTVDCESVDGATDSPLTTAAPCTDLYSNCAEVCEWYPDDCKKSCGTC